MKKNPIALIFVASLCLLGMEAQSGEKFSGWKKADTEHFTFIYENASRETTEAYAEIADDAWNKIANIYSIPKNHFNVYVTDRTNTVNAFTYFAPTEIGMFTTPPTINDFGFRAPWKTLFFTHELIHAANATFEEKDRTAEYIFGPFVKNLDLIGVNDWALEGLTTVLETELTAGGRGRSPYFELEYKAPTLENSLISYKQIGLEQEPPRGQSYVLGYVIMRSIADRWGIQALADIERNRTLLGSWEESVKLVTGLTPEEIYRDAKIALVKKYAQEREISEGITISPRTVNTNYYEPAIIFEDGSLIALRTKTGSGTAIVKLNPALKNGSAYLEQTHPDKDLNTVFNETILFEGMFNEPHCVTADSNGVIYVSMGESSYHKTPGTSLELSIYKWTKENGLQRLTKGASYSQPSVSRDGKTLVALRQYGLTFALVKIDTETGAETVLLKDSSQDFIQPSVNEDGSKIAFMAVDGERAKICVAAMESPENFEVIYNGEGEITDPSYPHWVEGKLVITDNQRGRLETFEYSDDDFIPVVADPCGVLWASKTKKGIIYSTFSATGYVLKIKPESEWGNVPDFEGPSMPGEIIKFGALEVDYPDFVPYEKLCEVEVPEKTPKELKAEAKNRNKEEPVPIKGKVVKHRKDETIEQLKNLPDPKIELSEEKIYVPFPTPLLYFPYATPVADKENIYWGVGAALVCLTPKLQMSYGACFGSFTYFPSLNNFDGTVVYYSGIGAGTLQVLAARVLSDGYEDDSENRDFSESNTFDLAYKRPVFDVSDGRKSTLISAFADSNFQARIESPEAFAAFSKNDYKYNLNAIAGLEFVESKKKANIINTFETDLYGLGMYDFDFKKLFPGLESEISLTYKNLSSGTSIDANLKLRYTDYPSETAVRSSLVKFHGKVLDCTYPGRGVLQLGTSMNNFLGIGLDLRLYGEGLASFGQNSVDYETPTNGNWMNMTFTKDLAWGVECGFISNELELVFGYNVLGDIFNLENAITGEFYFTFKYDWFRY